MSAATTGTVAELHGSVVTVGEPFQVTPSSPMKMAQMEISQYEKIIDSKSESQCKQWSVQMPGPK